VVIKQGPGFPAMLLDKTVAVVVPAYNEEKLLGR